MSEKINNEKKGTLGFVYFTYAKDEKLLEASVKILNQLKRQCADTFNIKIAIIDDANDPLPEGHVPEHDYYAQTSVPRNNNLLGTEWILCQLDTMNDVCKRFDADHIVKIDSDVCVGNLSIFSKYIDKEVALSECYNAEGLPFLTGSFYSLHKNVINAVAAEAHRVFDSSDKIDNVLEDAAISNIVRLLGYNLVTAVNSIMMYNEFDEKNVLNKLCTICRTPKVNKDENFDEKKEANEAYAKAYTCLAHHRLRYHTSVNIFTYEGDGAVLLPCVRCVVGSFKNRDFDVYVMDDDEHPITDEQREAILKISDRVHYRRTTFNRHKNLNGKECMLGIMDCFIENAAGREGITIKLDPDTMILRPYIFDEFRIVESCKYIASTRPGCTFSGICYALDNSILHSTKRILNCTDIPDDRGPEDLMIGCCATLAGAPGCSLLYEPWSNKECKNATSAAWDYSTEATGEVADVFARLFDIITLGNWFIYKDTTKFSRIKPGELLADRVENGYVDKFRHNGRYFRV